MRTQWYDFNKQKNPVNCRVLGEIGVGEWRWKCTKIIDSSIDLVSRAEENDISRICKVVISICQRCLPSPMFFLGMLPFEYLSKKKKKDSKKHPSSFLPPLNIYSIFLTVGTKLATKSREMWSTGQDFIFDMFDSQVQHTESGKKIWGKIWMSTETTLRSLDFNDILTYGVI